MTPVHTSSPDRRGRTWTIYQVPAPDNRWIALEHTPAGTPTGNSYRGPTFDHAHAHTERERTRTR